MRAIRMTALAALACAALFTGAGAAAAESPSPDAGNSDDGPTRAGTGFRDATVVPPGKSGTADASSGDYLYWVFPVDAGQRPTFKAKVTLPESTARQAHATWRIDVYDGLRRRQPCMYGMQNRAAAPDAESVELACTLRPVRSLADPWSDQPLPGSYYLRLTVTDASEKDLGLPVKAEVEADLKDAGGAYAVDGSLSTPLVTGASATQDDGDGEDSGDGEEQDGAGDEGDGNEASPDTERQTASTPVEPEDGWSSGWWSDRWIWTGAGGILAALAGVGGYALARGPRRPSRVPPGV